MHVAGPDTRDQMRCVLQLEQLRNGIQIGIVGLRQAATP